MAGGGACAKSPGVTTMKVYEDISEARDLKGAALCMGNFDGVHLGHVALFREATRHGKGAALTFWPHPGKVLQPELAPKLITTQARKLELMAAAGLSATIVQPFSLAFAHTTRDDFEALLLDQLGLGHLVVGGDFTYGRGRAGTVETLREATAKRGAQVHVVPQVSVDGVVVSSSRVREYILEGRVSAARRLLGRWFDLQGTVVTGQQRGRTIGWPTANVDTSNELRPAAGVYAVRVRESPSDPWLGGVANIGVKPTFGGSEVTIEVHVLDFQGDLYGKQLQVQFIERLRAERRFGSIAELSNQIGRDAESAREVIASIGA